MFRQSLTRLELPLSNVAVVSKLVLQTDRMGQKIDLKGHKMIKSRKKISAMLCKFFLDFHIIYSSFFVFFF